MVIGMVLNILQFSLVQSKILDKRWFSVSNSTLNVDMKFVMPKTIIKIEPRISNNGPYCVSDLPTFIQSEIKGTR